MMREWQPEDAEAIPFSRANIAAVLGVSLGQLNNWIDRNRLWQTDRGRKFHRPYFLREVFDLAGFSALRIARIPEDYCSKFVYNFGFYREFLHGDQLAEFSYREKWDMGIYDPNAAISLRINMRTIGERIFDRISKEIASSPEKWPAESFDSFQKLYHRGIGQDRLSAGSAPLFDTDTPE